MTNLAPVASHTPAPDTSPQAADPLWYRDATIYQLHVKSFADSNGDGIGDFRGLIQKLDYILELGTDTIWLLPFYPSPRRDDGYDISDYRGVHPDYGTMDDVREFIAEAHARGMRVVTELVINHTSNEHPWFQAARKAPPGSPERDFYVWSDNDTAYAGTRVIFVDTERSNWTWDPVAGAYFWHRFYSHQPDLNFDNPAVLEEVLSVMRFWLDTGVDGLRLDAVPYLVEREGTNNENLPETHAILKKIRAELDAYAPGKMLLAEANQWPEDAQQYFGDGDECNMSFHFPLMPRMYMAIAREDRFPITDIMRQTPSIPENCQWVVFLRNHDELTLEMVTDSERDYLWSTYASDRRARINLGIRRRLAPLLEHDRRRIELMNGLLLSMPGTPVIYYGDEIGMGDNIHLGDRDGVRTPMQWSPDRNGGFSRADPEGLILPPIMGPIYGFAAVNVEAQESDQHSLLNWTRRLLAVRKTYRAFGRGVQRFLYPSNRKVLAFLRSFDDQDILCVSNLSRTAQAVEVDLGDFSGRIPVDLLGGSAFPPVGQLPYLLTMPPYAFYWFILARETEMPSSHTPAPEAMPDLTTLVLRRGLADVMAPAARGMIEGDMLKPYLALRRWFAAKDRAIASARITHAAVLEGEGSDILLAELEVHSAGEGGRTDAYLLPLGIVWEDEASGALPQQLALARVRRGRRVGLLTDGFAVDALPHTVLALLRTHAKVAYDGGSIVFEPTARLADIDVQPGAEIRRMSAEQSNSSLIIGDAAMLKVLRRTTSGIHPEIEMSDYLTANGYGNAPPLLGSAWRVSEAVEGKEADRQALIVVQGFVRNQGDGWTWLLDFLSRTADTLAMATDDRAEEVDAFAPLLSFTGAIGKRLAELHAVLARPTDDAAFKPEPANAEDSAEWAADIRAQLEAAISAVGRIDSWTDPVAAEDAAFLTANAPKVLEKGGGLDQLLAAIPGTLKTRIHGDFHLGQVLVVQDDAYLIDFEGEPARPLSERRAKSSPLRDVAGMLRSFDYARAVAAPGRAAMTPSAVERRTPILLRAHKAMAATFMDAYRLAHDKAEHRWALPEAEESLTTLFLLQKAAYEVCYEAANRIGWLPVPLHGLADLVGRLTGASDRTQQG
jgi:maltose alpha-D-glucosyltransferase/alpha-amylase